jgi:hypothetical protein
MGDPMPDDGRIRVAIAHFDCWKYLTLLWSLPLTLVVIGYFINGTKLFTLEHLMNYQTVFIPKIVGIPLFLGLLVFLLLHSIEAISSRDVFIWTDGDSVKVLGRRKIRLTDLDLSLRKRSGPLNSLIVIPRHSGGEMRIPMGIIHETEDVLIRSFDRVTNSIPSAATVKRDDGRS